MLCQILGEAQFAWKVPFLSTLFFSVIEIIVTHIISAKFQTKHILLGHLLALSVYKKLWFISRLQAPLGGQGRRDAARDPAEHPGGPVGGRQAAVGRRQQVPRGVAQREDQGQRRKPQGAGQDKRGAEWPSGFL